LASDGLVPHRRHDRDTHLLYDLYPLVLYSLCVYEEVEENVTVSVMWCRMVGRPLSLPLGMGIFPLWRCCWREGPISTTRVMYDRGEVDMALCVYEEGQENLTLSIYVV